MEYRKLGNSDLKVSAITLGTWAIGGWFWGGTDEPDAIAAIRRAVDLGMTSVDTAPMYGFGLSEEIVGKALEGRRDKAQILTKYSMRWDLAEGQYWFETKTTDGKPAKIYINAKKHSIIEECERSLKRLRTDHIDLYQCHWPDITTPLDETMEAIGSLLQQGKIRAAGVSNFSAEQIETASKVVPIASDQPPYSMVRREIEKDVLPYCRTHNVGVIVYSPLQLGLLSGALTMDRKFPADDQRARSPYFKPENRRKVIDFLDRIRPIADAHGASIAQLVINWTIHQPGITSALVGARNPAQVEENAGALAFKLTGAETSRIDRLLGELTLAM